MQYHNYFDNGYPYLFYNILGLLIIEYPENLSSAWFLSFFYKYLTQKIIVRGDNYILSLYDNPVDNLLSLLETHSPLDSHNKAVSI